MIRVTIELLSANSPDKSNNRKILSEMDIWNVVESTPKKIHEYRYVGWFLGMDSELEKKNFSGLVKHDRLKNIYFLIKKIVDNLT